MTKILESIAVKVVADSEPPIFVESNVLKESGPEVVIELVPLQKDIFSQLTEIEELSIETLVNFSVKPTMKLVSFLILMRDSLSLRSPDVYDTSQIFLHETGSQEIMLLLVQSALSSHHG